VARWCSACSICAARKGKPTPRKIPLTQLPCGAPLERLALDILDTSKKGNRYILVITDYFTKWTDAFALKRHTAPIVAETLMFKFIAQHGAPKQIHSDQGPEFESNLYKELARLLQISKYRTTPYRPQSDGQVERFNRTLLNMLSAFVSERADDWDTHIPLLMMAYRSAVHASTGCTPFSMMYGREMNLPVDLQFPTNSDFEGRPDCPSEYVEWVRRSIASAHDFARTHLGRSRARQKKGYDAHTKPKEPYKVGDLVRYYYPPSMNCNKFARPWLGPYKVLTKVTEVDYKISKVSHPDKTRVVHYDTLKLFEGTKDTPDQFVDDFTYDHSGPDNELIDQNVLDNPNIIDPIPKLEQIALPGSSTDSNEGGIHYTPPVIHGLRPRREAKAPVRYGDWVQY
jgi:transposase InsO family protein